MSGTSEQSLQAIRAAQSSLLSLLAHALSSLDSVAPRVLIPEIAAPLDVLRDSAALTKAHATRLSIALRPPIASDVAAKFLRELATTVVPAFMAGAESLIPEVHGKVLKLECVDSVRQVLRAIEHLVHEIEVSDTSTSRDRLLNTGVVWGACDRIIAISGEALTGVVCQRMQSNAEVFGDAVQELQEWLDDNVEEEEMEEEGEEERTEDELEFWEASKKKLAKDDVETKKRIERSLKTMKLTSILFKAARKRRLGNTAEGKLVTNVHVLDRIAEVSKELAEIGDDLAMSYYEDNVDEAAEAENSLEQKAIELASLLSPSNEGKSDGFTRWFENCKAAFSKRL